MDDSSADELVRFLPDGTTRVFGIVGDPIAQVRSPRTMTEAFRRRGHNAVLLPLRISRENLDVTLPALKHIGNLDGLVITLPHKVAALHHADVLNPETQLIGAVNVLRRERDGRWRGENFDGSGFIAGLLTHGHDPRGRKVLLIGCGGAGAAIAFALARAGIAELRLLDVVAARAASLAERLALTTRDLPIRVAGPDLSGVDMLVNATPCGMDGDSTLPLDASRLEAHLLVAEAVNKPTITPLLQAAQQRGCRVHSGVHMSQGQSKLLLEFLLPETAD